MEKYRENLLALTGESSTASIAKVIGVPKPTFNSQVLNERITIENLVEISRKYNLDILELLTALGIITQLEAKRARNKSSLSSFSTDELAKEVYERTLRETLREQERYRLAAENDNQEDYDEGDMTP